MQSRRMKFFARFFFIAKTYRPQSRARGTRVAGAHEKAHEEAHEKAHEKARENAHEKAHEKACTKSLPLKS